METNLAGVPKIVPPGGGIRVESPSEQVHIKLSASETGGAFMFVELTVQPGVGPPYHIHTREDELFYVLEGEIDFIIDGTRHRCPAGSTVFGARGVPHTFRGAGSGPAKCTVMVTGSSFGEFYGRLGAMMANGQPDVAALVSLAAEYGLQFLPDPD